MLTHDGKPKSNRMNLALSPEKAIFAHMKRHLYIISGCNGVGKTTASYMGLPEILKVEEFVFPSCSRM